MAKPTWENAPEWANYMAMDANGAWYWYEEEPKLIEGVGYFIAPGKLERANHVPDVTKTVQRRSK